MPIDYEHMEQAALFTWVEMEGKKLYPELELLHAIPNGGKRDRRTGAKMKAEGVKPSIPDIFLPVARHGYHGFYIEMKVIYPSGRQSYPSPEQREMIAALEAQGYKVLVYWTWEAAADALKRYLD